MLLQNLQNLLNFNLSAFIILFFGAALHSEVIFLEGFAIENETSYKTIRKLSPDTILYCNPKCIFKINNSERNIDFKGFGTYEDLLRIKEKPKNEVKEEHEVRTKANGMIKFKESIPFPDTGAIILHKKSFEEFIYPGHNCRTDCWINIEIEGRPKFSKIFSKGEVPFYQLKIPEDYEGNVKWSLEFTEGELEKGHFEIRLRTERTYEEMILNRKNIILYE